MQVRIFKELEKFEVEKLIETFIVSVPSNCITLPKFLVVSFSKVRGASESCSMVQQTTYICFVHLGALRSQGFSV